VRDVSAEVARLQQVKLLVTKPDGTIAADPGVLLAGADLWKFGFKILDKSRPDGFTFYLQTFTAAGLDGDTRTRAAGRFYAVEDPDATTRLLFVWLPTPLARALEAGNLEQPLNFHVLFHPPTYEQNYVRTPYWNGKDPQTSTAEYVHLGMRYLCVDFAAIAHHVLAVSARTPNTAIVIPVADNPGNFADMVTGAGMVRKLYGLYDFLSRQANPSVPPRFDKIGKVMVSGYSRSGNRLVALFADRTGKNAPFFSDHLSQVNAFDINLGNNDGERLPAFTKLLEGIRGWAGAVRGARAFIYTAYRSHYNLWVGAPITSGTLWAERTEVELDSVTWSDTALQAKKGDLRGTAAESYGGDGRFGAVHLPITFFQFYLNNKKPDGTDDPLGNKTRGWSDSHYHTGGFHGHGLFLRGMMSHAFSHADPAYFGGPNPPNQPKP
jgi:hypothetical protein